MNIQSKQKKHRPKVSLGKPHPWDFGATGPANMHGMKIEPATEIDPRSGRETPNPNGVMRRRRDDWLTRYMTQGKLTKQQASAGEKLRRAAEGVKEQDPLAALKIDRVLGQSDPLAARVDARAWFREIWAKIPTHCKPVLERVAVDDLPIWHGNTMQRERHMQRLREGLDAIS